LAGESEGIIKGPSWRWKWLPTLPFSGFSIDIYRTDTLVTASIPVPVWGRPAFIARSIYSGWCGHYLDITTIEGEKKGRKGQNWEGEKERKGVEKERIDCLVFKLATVALSIDANPYNHNPSMHGTQLVLRRFRGQVIYLL
jgi:hypothetical protein